MTKATESGPSEPGALFISHANPEDNVFTLWLGAKLEALGFEVWADLMRLRGGSDWETKLETAIRERARKVLFVGTPEAASKRGTRNEIEIATAVATERADEEFIIPLRLRAYRPPFRIAHAQYIDFENRGWAAGLAELLDTLSDAGVLPVVPHASSGVWRIIQTQHAKPLVESPERLVSNWLEIAKLPRTIRFFDFAGGIVRDLADQRIRMSPYPAVPHFRGFLSFASEQDLVPHFGPQLPLTVVAEMPTDRFIENGWSDPVRVHRREARNHFVDMAHQALAATLASRGLTPHAMGGGRTAWWPRLDAAPTNKVPFRWGAIAGLRQLQGVSAKRGVHWHFGASMNVRTSPLQYVHVGGTLVFSDDGRRAIDDAGRAHRLRRSFAKGWRNARWRDMMLAFLYWLADGGDFLDVPTGSESALRITLPPLRFVSSVSVATASSEAADEDDPELDDAMLQSDDPAHGEEIA
ncbi:MAG TPA: toll/interleukin-1 receptor domain-containing protein [Candidatus Limnocylindrales bacterium]|nr:toll/interleukin-1 receptor domain-containing protein [Candidatus Limnocylindrales bacterium]